MKKDEILKRLKGGLIVSCQAEPEKGSQLWRPIEIARMAKEALLAGAAGVRICGKKNIAETRKENPDAIITGITKSKYPDDRVLITPDLDAVKDIVTAGATIVGMDFTARPRPNSIQSIELFKEAKKLFPAMLFLADISTAEEAKTAVKAGVDMVATTLPGYTPYTEFRLKPHKWYEYWPDIELLRELVQLFPGFPVIAEGRWRSPELCWQAIRAGAFAVCDGSAITRPREMVRWRIQAIQYGGYTAKENKD